MKPTYCWEHGTHTPHSACPAHRAARKARNKEKALKGWRTRRRTTQEAEREEGTVAHPDQITTPS